MTMSSVTKGVSTVLKNLPVQIYVLGEYKVRHNGEIYVLDSSHFHELLETFLSSESHVLVTPESRTTIQDVVIVMDKIVDAGLDNVSLTGSFDER